MDELKPDGNYLFYGDNLDVMRRYIPDKCVDLVYLDPPFKSNHDYKLFDEKNGSRTASQILAFGDTWHWDSESRCIFDAMTSADQLNRGGVYSKVAKTLTGLSGFLGTNDMMAYITMMAPRLIELRRAMKLTASIYLHCDATASHYLKVLMDAVFGGEGYRREIVWRSGWVSGFKTKTNNWVRNHDVLLYYVMDAKNATFNKDKAFHPHREGYERRGGGGNPKGVPIDDVWDDSELYSPWIKSFSKEKLGYATQKPLALLERIISVCSNEGDTVLDPFCGCGTTVVAAQKLNRRWLGIDITHLAIGLIKHRLVETYGEDAKFTVAGEPVDYKTAKALADSDIQQFKYWALGIVGARPFERKKGADSGIDGVLYFEPEGPAGAKEKAVVSVNGGKVNISDIRALQDAIDHEEAKIGVMIMLDKPTSEMQREAGRAGYYNPEGTGKSKYARLQILTVEDLLNGTKVAFSNLDSGNVTHDRTRKTVGKN